MLKNSNLFFASVLLFTLASPISLASEINQEQVITEKIDIPDISGVLKKINGSMGLGYESNFYAYNSSDKDQSLNFELGLDFTNNEIKYGLATSLSKDMIATEKVKWEDTSLSMTKGLDLFPLHSPFSSTGRLGLTLATSEKSRYEKSMYAYLSVSPSINWSKDSFMLQLTPSLGKVFNQYKTTWAGESNPSHYVKFSVRPSYQFTDSWSSFLSTSATQYWTETGGRKPPKYSTGIGTEWKFEQKTSISLDVSNEDTIYKSDGKTSNMNFYDKSQANYALTLNREF